MKIKIGIDRQAVMLATGEDRGEFTEIEITKEQMGDDWPTLVAGLDTGAPPKYIPAQNIKGLDAAAIRAAMHERRMLDRAKLDAYAASLAAVQEAAEQPMAFCQKFASVASSVIVGQEIGVHNVNIYDAERDDTVGIAWPGRTLPSLESCSGLLGENEGEKALLFARWMDIDSQNQKAVTEARQAAISMIAVELTRTHEEWLAQCEKAKADEEAKRQQQIAERAAVRLATGYWELETERYNERRYSSPWCAQVSFSLGAKAVYTFGDSTGKWGKAGLLRVPCKPGDIIAHGQRDLRRPADSDHTLLIMLPSGRMRTVDKTEAFRLWQQARAKN